MNKKYIISICIPTYNREKSLKNLIDNIINQEWFSEEIQIMIYNDPSQDNTQLMVEEYQKKYPNIKYHRNKTRIGMIPSILESITMCDWEYVWLFSDDDLMHITAIKEMLKTIKEQNPWLILNKMLWAYDENSMDIKRQNNHWSIKTVTWVEKLFDFLSDIDYSIDWYLAHCSLFCFKKAIYIKNLNSLLKEHWESYMETLKKDYLAHVRIIYIPFWNTEKITVIEKNLVLVRWGNISRNFRFKVIQDFRNLTKDLCRRYKINKKVRRKMMILHFYGIFCYFIIAHVRRRLPKKIYNLLFNLWRKAIRLIKIW